MTLSLQAQAEVPAEASAPAASAPAASAPAANAPAANAPAANAPAANVPAASAPAASAPGEEAQAQAPKPGTAAAVAADNAAAALGAYTPVLPARPWMRRDSFLVGLSIAAVIGGASGYPNDDLKIDRSEYYTNTGVGGGGSASLWLGYAMADWITFGLTVNGGVLSTGDYLVRFGGGGIRVDVFPGWPLGGEWRELGAFLDAGIGYALADVTGANADPVIDSGGNSHLGLGLFYERIRLWQFSMGPYAAFDYVWSKGASRPTGCLGWRTVYYAGP